MEINALEIVMKLKLGGQEMVLVQYDTIPNLRCLLSQVQELV